jgi:hypothetical protein
MHCCVQQLEKMVRESVGEIVTALSKKVSKTELAKALSTKADACVYRAPTACVEGVGSGSPPSHASCLTFVGSACAFVVRFSSRK